MFGCEWTISPEPSLLALHVGQRGQDIGRVHCISPRRSIHVPAGIKANRGQGRADPGRGEHSDAFMRKASPKVLDDGVAKLGRESQGADVSVFARHDREERIGRG